MNDTKILPILLLVAILGLTIYSIAISSPHKLGSASSGVAAFVASTSQPTIGTTAVLIAATSTCNARIITTYASPVMLTFTERGQDVPSALIGHLQVASTTVTYDSALYGCDAVQAYSFVSTKDYVTETR